LAAFSVAAHLRDYVKGATHVEKRRYISGTKIPSATVVLKIRDDDWAPEKKIRRRDALHPAVPG
jgi:hypothetical protein